MAAPKSSFLNLILALGSVTLLSAFSLGYVYEWTLEPIATAKREKQLRAINAVVEFDNDPLAESFEVVKGQHQYRHRKRKGQAQAEESDPDALVFYPAKKQDTLTSYAIKSYSDQGYSGRIEIMVGFEMDGRIREVQVLSHRETPGLGSKITNADFLSQFVGQYPELFDLRVTKDGGEVDGISGATISSRAVGEAIKTAYDNFKGIDNE
ncbi:MAG: RnfABCDGE type electron transport complex subunit G [Cyclobacteriaceae bacterium]